MIDSAVKIRPKEGEVYFDVVAVVDPVTRDAQKLAPLLLVSYNRHPDGSSWFIWPRPNVIVFFLTDVPVLLDISPLQVLTQLVNINLRVFMNCQSKLSDMPLKRWELNFNRIGPINGSFFLWLEVRQTSWCWCLCAQSFCSLFKNPDV